MPIASKLVYFQRRPSPAPPDPGPEPPDPRRRAGRDPSSRQRRRSSLSSHHKPVSPKVMIFDTRNGELSSEGAELVLLNLPPDNKSNAHTSLCPGDSIPASKVDEECTAEEPVCSNADDSTPVPDLERSSACRGGTEEGEGDDRGCEPPASECSICLERCGGEEDGRLALLRCGHVFHSACLDRWLRSRGDCPYCRATVLRP
ncbi:hypothetical protein HU200_010715 [Digitaria exilis]|uniref:RING-type domain-containing protein n=1 Tax=Digitaria exilis TaxID=1010633 RepID=A0A835FIJ4_9POAL|nr:hypothetical protein HU200_010715 [Digitaria exilis]